MQKNAIIETLHKHRDAIQAFGVGALYLFGSHARGEAGPASDVDIFIDRAPGMPFGFLELTNLEFFLTETLGTDVDVMTRTALHPDLRLKIETSAVQVF